MVTVIIPPGYSLGMRRWGQFLVNVTIDDGQWHMSISHPRRDLTYDEIKKARYRFVPNQATMALIFPPPDEFLNFHEHCFHLWEIPGEEPPTPEERAKLVMANKMGTKVRAKERAERRDDSDGFR